MTVPAPETKLGPTTIDREIGRGGTDVVYLGHDMHLDHTVAIKVLQAALASDPERVLRFQREAKLLASLDHPSIASIHGFEEADDRCFLVLELAEGEALARGLKTGPPPIDDVLTICMQIAEARG